MPCIEILLQNIFEDNDEIRRIFSPRVTVIEIRKRVWACIRRREGYLEHFFANKDVFEIALFSLHSTYHQLINLFLRMLSIILGFWIANKPRKFF